MKNLFIIALLAIFAGCSPEPELHLFDGGDINLNLPVVKLELDAYWDYTTAYGQYNWRDE